MMALTSLCYSIYSIWLPVNREGLKSGCNSTARISEFSALLLLDSPVFAIEFLLGKDGNAVRDRMYVQQPRTELEIAEDHL